MSKIFKPRRILKSKAASLNPVLAAGEMIIEVPDTGVGTGCCIMKIGDGKTAYVDLPISMGGSADNIVYSGSVDGVSVNNVRSALDNLISKYNSFNDAKSVIVSSALGKALSLTNTSTWSNVIDSIKSITTKVSESTAITTSGKFGFDTKYGPWVYIPVNAYYKTGHWLNIPWSTFKGLCGTAAAGHILSGYTATSQNGIKISGSMVNRGNLNWSGSNTTHSVSAGYYSGGTLDSRPSYNNGYNAGRNQGKKDTGTYGLHHFLRLYSNPSPNTYLMNPSATSSGSTHWQNPGYAYNSDIFNYSNGVYTAKVACRLGIDAEFHTRYGRSRHYILYSINNGTKYDIINKAGSDDDYSDYQAHGYVILSLSAGQNIRFFFGDAESNNTDTDFIVLARIV